jgi:hypothetical protein
MHFLITLIITFFASSIQAHAQADGGAGANVELQRIMETPMESLLPCTAKHEMIVYTLKESDGKNIQVAIECRAGKLTAKWPQAQIPKIEMHCLPP